MEKCPRCGLMADAVETIKAPRMPDVNGDRIYDLVGHIYYHSSGTNCAVPRIGVAYAICPGYGAICLEYQLVPHLTGTGDAPCCPDRGTAVVVGNRWEI